MAFSNIPASNPHVLWLARWHALRTEIDALAAIDIDPPQAVYDELFAIEGLVTSTPPTTKAGMMAIIEIMQHELTRACDPDTPAHQALATLAAGIAAGI